MLKALVIIDNIAFLFDKESCKEEYYSNIKKYHRDGIKVLRIKSRKHQLPESLIPRVYRSPINDVFLEIFEDLYYNQVLSSTDIAEIYGYTQPTAYNAMKRAGIKFITKGFRRSRDLEKNSKNRSKLVSRKCENPECSKMVSTTLKRNIRFCSKNCASKIRWAK